MTKAYWIANYTEIKDDERLKKYAVKAKEAVEKYSGKILARSANNITLEGRKMVRVLLWVKLTNYHRLPRRTSTCITTSIRTK